MLVKMYKRLEREQAGAEDLSDDPTNQQAQFTREELAMRMNYIKHFPNLERYLPIFPQEKLSEAKLQKQSEIISLIDRKVQAGLLESIVEEWTR